MCRYLEELSDDLAARNAALLGALKDLVERVDDGPRSVAAIMVSNPNQVAIKGSFLEAIERARALIKIEEFGEDE